MSIKKMSSIILKTAVITIVSVIVEIIVSMFIPWPEDFKRQASTDPSTALFYSIVVNFVYSAAIAFVAVKSRWKGFKLAGTLFICVFGMQSFMMQIETLLFGSAFKALSAFTVMLLVLSAFVKIAIVTPIAVLIFGKFKSSQPAGQENKLNYLFSKDLLWKLPLIGVCYMFLYFFFGHFVAWQSPAVREFYATTAITTHFEITVPIQIIRGMMWVGFGMPLFVMFSSRRDALIASVLMYSLFPSIQLLLPSPFMPEAVRFAHLVEILSSMAVFGILTGTIMTRKKLSAESSKVVAGLL